jgi:hypothetical protein
MPDMTTDADMIDFMMNDVIPQGSQMSVLHQSLFTVGSRMR